MASLIKAVKYIISVSVVLLFFVSLAGVDASRQEEAGRGRRKSDLPKVISKVKSLTILSTEIKRISANMELMEITLRNETDKPVIAVIIDVRDDNLGAGETVNGFNDGDEPPDVIMEPFGFLTVSFDLDKLKHFKPGTPIRVGGVMFADETEDGDEASLRSIRGQREHYKAQKPKQEERQ